MANKKKEIKKRKEKVNDNVLEFIETQKTGDNKETLEDIKQVKEKKHHPVLLSLVMLLLGALLGVIGLITLSVNNILTIKNFNNNLDVKKNDTTNCLKVDTDVEKDEVKSLDGDSYLIKRLLNQMSFNEVSSFITSLYKEDKVTPSTLSSDFVNSIVLKKARAEFGNTFTLDQIMSAKDYLFGSNSNVSLENNKSYDYGCGTYKLNNDTHYYEYSETANCNRNIGTSLISKVESANRINDEIIINIRIGLKTEKGLYAGPSNDYERLDNDFNVGNESAKLKLYKVVFVYDDINNEYVFMSSEPVK